MASTRPTPTAKAPPERRDWVDAAGSVASQSVGPSLANARAACAHRHGLRGRIGDGVQCIAPRVGCREGAWHPRSADLTTSPPRSSNDAANLDGSSSNSATNERRSPRALPRPNHSVRECRAADRNACAEVPRRRSAWRTESPIGRAGSTRARRRSRVRSAPIRIGAATRRSRARLGRLPRGPVRRSRSSRP